MHRPQRILLYSDLPSEQIALTLVEQEGIDVLHNVLESWDPRSRRFEDLDGLRVRQGIAFLVPLLESNTNPVPLRSLFRILCKRWQVNVLVIEHPYVEMEFWDTYASFHSRSFLPHPKVCWRVHFFKSTGSNNARLIEDIRAGATQKGLAESGFEYLGFTTLRPTPSFNLGRTALKFDEKIGRERGLAEGGTEGDAIELGGKRFCKGKSVQAANIYATKLEVDAVPYLQQDPVAGMCATASLWVASQVLAAKFELHKFPYLQITRQAEVSSGRVLPPDETDNVQFPHGLSVREICAVITRTGAVPLVVRPFSASDPSAQMRDVLYTFVESELPVVLCCERPGRAGHAVVTAGHALPPPTRKQWDARSQSMQHVYAKASPNQFLISQAVTRYYVHDDAYGPYNRLDFQPLDELPETVTKEYKKYRKDLFCPVVLAREKEDVWNLWAMVVPMPPYVKNRPDTIMPDASVRFAKLFAKPPFQEQNCRVLWRTLLMKGSRFKRSLVERQFAPALIEAYSQLHLPKYIWLFEITICPIDEMAEGVSQGKNRLVMGEFIYDTTTPHYTTRVIVQRVGRLFVTHPRPDMLPASDLKSLYQQSLLPGEVLPRPCFSGDPQD